MGLFNNREIATALWLLIIALWLLQKADHRSSVIDVLHSFFRIKIIVPIALMFLYAVFLVIGMHSIKLWNFSLLKDTIFWFFFSALITMVNTATQKDTSFIFHRALKDNLKCVIFLEFLINTYTFPILGEFILLPILTFLAVAGTLANTKDEFLGLSRIIQSCQTFLGFIILFFVIQKAIIGWHTLRSISTFQSILLSPLLSIGMIPFIYFLLLYSKYEQIFLRLNIGIKKSSKLNRYIKWQAIQHAKLSLIKLDMFSKDYVFRLMHAENKADVDHIFNDVLP